MINKTVNKSSQNKTTTGKKLSVLERIQPIGSYADTPIKILLYGKSGTGKTSLWASFPKPILSIVCSGGNQFGELKSIQTDENADSIFRVGLEESSEIKDIVKLVKSSNEYKTIVIDHLTGLQDLVLKEVLGLEDMPLSKSWGTARIQDYGTCTVQCKEYIHSLLSLDVNVVLIAQERTFNNKDEEGTSDDEVLKPFVAAGLTPSLVGYLNSSVDYICQTFIKDKEEIVEKEIGGKKVRKKQVIEGKVDYCLRTAPSATYITKFRTANRKERDNFLINPTYEKVNKLILGK